MTTPAAVAGRVAGILGGNWKAGAGPWETYGRLDAPDADTYTLHVDDHGELCLWANLDPGGEIASFREIHAPPRGSGRLPRPSQGRFASTTPPPTRSKGACPPPKRAYN
jgi:hypothetical protein